MSEMNLPNSSAAPTVESYGPGSGASQNQIQSRLGDIGAFNLAHSIKLLEAISGFQQSMDVFRNARNGFEDGKLSPEAIRKLWEQGRLTQSMPKELAAKLNFIEPI